MSFGFSNEVPVIGRAIRAAELQRDGRVLFLAAASNSGANRREMFPATHDAVISVRETNSQGAFSDTNPPVDVDGPIVFGTLGRDVPSAWLRSVSGELPKSGSSVATAVASGIAAMMLALTNAGYHPDAGAAALPPEAARLWTRRGMRAMFLKMSQNMGNRSYYISPLGFFSDKNAAKCWTAIADASAY